MTEPVGRPAIVLVGSVRSSLLTLEVLLREGGNVRAVFGLAPPPDGRVSGYERMDDLAATHGVPYAEFTRVNDPDVVAAIASYRPDDLWVIGLSQLIGPALLAVPRRGSVGFHPTRLPVGRGRAAMAWSVLADVPLAATFFRIDAGMDSGPILAQVDVPVEPEDDVTERYRRLYEAIPVAAAVAARNAELGDEGLTPQDETAATYLGVRRPVDGTIDWKQPTDRVTRLIRASADPHPGAWTRDGATAIRVDRCMLPPAGRYLGVPGRIVDVRIDGAFVVSTADGALLVTAHWTDGPWRPRVGTTLGVDVEAELERLHERIAALERMIERATLPGAEPPH